MDTILYAGNIGCADTATSVHAQRNGALLEELGFKVVYCCYDPAPGRKIQNPDYAYVRPYLEHRKNRTAAWYRELYFGDEMYLFLKEKIRYHHPKYLILYGPAPIHFMSRIMKLCKKEKVIPIIEVTEWRGIELQKMLRSKRPFYYYINIFRDIRIRYFDKRCGNIIGISRFVCDHYRKSGCCVLELPPIFTEADFAKDITYKLQGRPVRLVFAGTMAAKDSVLPVLNAIATLNQEQIHFELDLIGPSKEEVLVEMKRFGLEIPIDEKYIFIHGRLTHDEVIEIVHRADFSLLLRENRQYAKAGVSTKFCEAACAGTPSICTAIGGTDLYVEDGKNGILIPDNEDDTVLKALQRIMNMNSDEINEIKKGALKLGRDQFDAGRYTEKMKHFLMETTKR